MTKGKLCEYKEGALCQKVYCSGCQIWLDFLEKVEKYSQELVRHKELYRVYPISLN